jgi:hypothetical protein
MKAYRGRRGTAPLTLNLAVVSFTRRERTAGTGVTYSCVGPSRSVWAPQQRLSGVTDSCVGPTAGLDFWRREKHLPVSGIEQRLFACSASRLVTLATVLQCAQEHREKWSLKLSDLNYS